MANSRGVEWWWGSQLWKEYGYNNIYVRMCQSKYKNVLISSKNVSKANNNNFRFKNKFEMMWLTRNTEVLDCFSLQKREVNACSI